MYYEESDEITKNNFIKGLFVANQLAQEKCIMLAFEIMDTYFMGTIERSLEYVQIIKSPWLKIYTDMGNLSQFTQTPCEQIENHYEHIVAYHIKDTKKNIFRDLELGKGEVNFDRIFSTIFKTKYNGPFLIEIWSKNEPNETFEENVEFIKRNLKFAKTKLEKAGWDVR